MAEATSDFYPHKALILAPTAGLTAETNGTVYKITRKGGANNDTRNFMLLAKMTQAGGTSATGKLYYEGSDDGTNFYPVLVLDTDAAETVAGHIAVAVPEYIRMRVVPAGGCTLTVRASLLSTHGFTITAQA